MAAARRDHQNHESLKRPTEFRRQSRPQGNRVDMTQREPWRQGYPGSLQPRGPTPRQRRQDGDGPSPQGNGPSPSPCRGNPPPGPPPGTASKGAKETCIAWLRNPRLTVTGSDLVSGVSAGFGGRGGALWAAVTGEFGLSAVERELLVEVCRTVDRLDSLEAADRGAWGDDDRRCRSGGREPCCLGGPRSRRGVASSGGGAEPPGGGWGSGAVYDDDPGSEGCDRCGGLRTTRCGRSGRVCDGNEVTTVGVRSGWGPRGDPGRAVRPLPSVLARC